MTIKEIMDKVDALCPNAFTDAQKMGFINECEAGLQNDIWLRSPDLYDKYVWENNEDTHALALPPYDEIYVYFTIAKIHLFMQEYTKYQNMTAIANNLRGAYLRWFAGHYAPAEKELAEREAAYDYDGNWAYQRFAFEIVIEDLETDAADLATAVMYIKQAARSVLTYTYGDDEEFDYTGTTATVSVPAADSAELALGLMYATVVTTDTDGVRNETSPPTVWRIKRSSEPAPAE